LGSATTFLVEGSDFTAAPRLLLNVPIREQQVKSTKPNSVEFGIQLDAEKTLPGIYLARIATNEGVSNAVPIAIDSLPQLPFAPTVSAIPVALHGSLSGNQV